MGLLKMTKSFPSVLAAACLLSAVPVSSVPAHANPADFYECGDMISVTGTSAEVEGSDDFKKYNGHVPADLAKLRAISGWQGAVADHCPEYSAVWRRATEKSIECDASSGHQHCTATAIPRRKILSWLLSY
jgi:hypothetical protein